MNVQCFNFRSASSDSQPGSSQEQYYSLGECTHAVLFFKCPHIEQGMIIFEYQVGGVCVCFYFFI